VAQLIVFSDIHGNLDALRAAWSDIQMRPHDTVVCLGDLAAFGPEPSACVRFVRDVIQPAAVIRGNTDRWLAQSDDDASLPEDVRASLAWTRESMDADEITYLGSLPATHDLVMEGVGLTFVHGAPDDDCFSFGPGVPPEDVAKAYGRDAGLTFCGHTHVPHRSRVGERVVINVGSVGLPYDGDRRAAYVRCTLAAGRMHDFETRRVAYGTFAVADQIATSGMPMANVISARLRFAELTRAGIV